MSLLLYNHYYLLCQMPDDFTCQLRESIGLSGLILNGKM
jgi:hypothetical protein